MEAKVDAVRTGYADHGRQFLVGNIEDRRIVSRIGDLDGVQHGFVAKPLQVLPVLCCAVIAEQMNFVELFGIQQASERSWLAGQWLGRFYSLQHLLLFAFWQRRRHRPQVGVSNPREEDASCRHEYYLVC